MLKYFNKIYLSYKNYRSSRHIKKYGSKNVGYFNVFDPEWFEVHQRGLLFLLNNFLLKYWIRFTFRIHKLINFNEKIYKIAPHYFEIQIGENEFKRFTYTHWKFSKRLYYGFFPVWWTLHFIDWLLLERIEMLPNFGFATLTAYPGPSSGGTTVDGVLMSNRSDATWATLRGSANYVNVTTGSHHGWYLYAQWRTSYYDWRWGQMTRSFFTFDTSSLGPSSVISSAKLSFYNAGKSVQNVSYSPVLNIVESMQANSNNLTTSDWDSVGSTSFASMAYSSYASGYNDFNLNSSGLANIMLTGISKFATRDYCDINNNPAPFSPLYPDDDDWYAAFYAGMYHSDYTGTSADPYLEITYTPGTIVRPVTGSTTAAADFTNKLKRILPAVQNLVGSITSTLKINKVASGSVNTSSSLEILNKLNLLSGSQANLSGVFDTINSLTRNVASSSNLSGALNVTNKLKVIRDIIATINTSLNVNSKLKVTRPVNSNIDSSLDVSNKIHIVKYILTSIEAVFNSQTKLILKKSSNSEITSSLEVLNKLINNKSSVSVLIGSIDLENKLTVTRIVNAYLDSALLTLNKLILHSGSSADVSSDLSVINRLTVLKSSVADISGDLDIINRLIVNKPRTADLTASFLADNTISLSLINALVFESSFNTEVKLTKLNPVNTGLESSLNIESKLTRILLGDTSISGVSDFLVSIKLVKSILVSLSAEMIINSAVNLYKSSSVGIEAVTDILAKLTNKKASEFSALSSADILVKLENVKSSILNLEADSEFYADILVSGKLYQMTLDLMSSLDVDTKINLVKSDSTSLQSNLDAAVRILNYCSTESNITARMIVDVTSKYYMTGTLNLESVSNILTRLKLTKSEVLTIEGVLNSINKLNIIKNGNSDLESSFESLVKIISSSGSTINLIGVSSFEISNIIRVISEQLNLESGLTIEMAIQALSIFNEILELTSKIEKEVKLNSDIINNILFASAIMQEEQAISSITTVFEKQSPISKEIILDSYIPEVNYDSL